LRTANCFLIVGALAAIPAAGQLIPVGVGVPKTALPPVVFVNGYQTSCGSTQFSATFGNFDSFLQSIGRVTLFFDNCTVAGKPPIETLGQDFGNFLAALKYADGTAVPQVDVVSHSMGGLIVRAYLAGMQTNGTFTPPVNPGIRKIVFLAAPHFGTYAASIFGSDQQTAEMSLGSTFAFALGTWNQDIDDLRGIDALAVEGNVGSILAGPTGQGDGVVSLTSGSIGFAEANKTVILPYCHISYASLSALAGPLASLACPAGSPGIALALTSTASNVQVVESFLSGTTAWQTIGEMPSQDPVASTQSGVILRAKSAADQFVNLVDASAGKTRLSTASSNATAYNEFVPPGSPTMLVDISGGSSQLQQPVSLGAGYTSAVTVKSGPSIGAVIPAAALITPRVVAPGTFISIYGSALAAAATQASTTPFPTTLGGVQVLVNGTAIPLQYVSPTQVNAVFPAAVSGLVTLTLTSGTPAGQSSVNIMTQATAPAIFTSNGTAASAENAVTGAVVTPSTPLHAGDYVSLFLTGLGLTAAGSGGLQYAVVQPVVTVAGQPCALQFAGLSPQFPGVDQINCQIPAGLGTNAAAPLIITSNGQPGNTATLVLQ
jgi:uncharacterized protein (TIGR03437 family)